MLTKYYHWGNLAAFSLLTDSGRIFGLPALFLRWLLLAVPLGAIIFYLSQGAWAQAGMAFGAGPTIALALFLHAMLTFRHQRTVQRNSTKNLMAG